MKNNLSVMVAGIQVRSNEDGLYSLNDIHKASGGERKNEPHLWLRSELALEAIRELEEETTQKCVVTKEGRGGGTYVDKILLGMYASWISSKFHILVYRVFFEAIEERARKLESENEALSDFRDGFYRMELANGMLAKDYSKLDQDTIKGIKMVIRKLKYKRELSIYDLISMPLIQPKAADRALEYVLRNVVTCLNPDYPRERQVFVAKQ